MISFISESTTLWLLAAFGLCLAFWFLDIGLQCVAWLRDRRLRAQLNLARRHPDVASAYPARPLNNSDQGGTARAASGVASQREASHPAKPAGILTFQIEQGKILRPQPNGHAPHHHDRKPI